MATADVPRHEGGSFEPVPRAPQDTARPYPPEADPVSREPDVEPAQVTGDQVDPLPEELDPENPRQDDRRDDGAEPPD